MTPAEGPSSSAGARSGSRLVLVFVIVAATAFAILRLYGDRVVERSRASTPISAARELVMADNTLVGVLGAIREVAPIDVRPLDAAGDTVALIAEVTGRQGRGVLYADVAREGHAWRVLRASFSTPDGERLPLEDGRPALDPAR